MMDTGTSLVINVSDASQVGDARRQALQLADRCDFAETGKSNLGIVVTELATNLAKHAQDGLLVLQASMPAGTGIDILALDRGPGIHILQKCLEDGYSTAGSRGVGLGAVKRLSNVFDVFSREPEGTVQLARLYSRPPADSDAADVRFGAVSVPAPGEARCGDAWALNRSPNAFSLMVVDGLGHGDLAFAAAQEAVRAFKSHPGFAPSAMLQEIHRILRATRGAAVSIVNVDIERRNVVFVGVGNVAGVLVAERKSQNMVSLNGTVGANTIRTREFTYELPPNATVVLYTDGLASATRLDPYPGLTNRDPAVIAGVLYRDFVRGRDDATVVAASIP